MYEYDVFGAIRASTGSSDSVWLFTGEQEDADSGLYYLRARYYNPSTGRFLGRDPVMAAEPYAYVGNSPTNHTDPSGMCVLDLPCDAGSTITVDRQGDEFVVRDTLPDPRSSPQYRAPLALT